MRALREIFVLLAWVLLTSCAALQGLDQYENVDCVGDCNEAGADDATAAQDGPIVPPPQTDATINDATVPEDGAAHADAPAEGAPAEDAAVEAMPPALYAIGGTVMGLTGSGLVLQKSGGDVLTLSGSDGGAAIPFTFPTKIAGGKDYIVTILTESSAPPQNCVVTGGKGTIVAGDVTSVVVNCTPKTYTIGGTITGLASSTGVVLRNNGGDDLTLNANGTFAFNTQALDAAPYSVKVFTDPSLPTQSCAVTGGSGNVAAANVTGVAVVCTTKTYTVGVTVTGLAGAGLVLRNNGGNNLSIPSSGAFTFSTPVASGQPYAVTVLTDPSNVTQHCTVTNGSGTIGSANVTGLAVACTTSTFTVGITVSGLTGSGLVLRNNGANNLSITGNASFTFSTPIASGQPYAVTVFTPPSSPAQVCTVGNGTGTVTTGNIANVTVSCVTTTCGNSVVTGTEERDPPPGPFSSAPVDALTCRYHFENVAQLYCSGACTWAGAQNCDQADADIFCKLKTGSATSTATAFTLGTALPLPGFSCPVGLGTNLGPMPTRGVSVNVYYQDTSILANHGPGQVITTVTCTP